MEVHWRCLPPQLMTVGATLLMTSTTFHSAFLALSPLLIVDSH